MLVLHVGWPRIDDASLPFPSGTLVHYEASQLLFRSEGVVLLYSERNFGTLGDSGLVLMLFLLVQSSGLLEVWS